MADLALESSAPWLGIPATAHCDLFAHFLGRASGAEVLGALHGHLDNAFDLVPRRAGALTRSQGKETRSEPHGCKQIEFKSIEMY